MKKIFLSLCFLTIFFISQAHEFWLAFEKFVVKVGENVPLSFLVGEDFSGEIWQGKMASFYLYNIQGKESIADLFPNKAEEKVVFTFKTEGTNLLAFNSQDKHIELEPDKFLAYLQEDGLEDVIALRKQKNETDKTGREQYQRCAKVLVQVGEKMDNTFKTKVGHTFEIIPEQNPYQAQNGTQIQFKLLFKNKPLPNNMVKIWRKTDGKLIKAYLKTDKKGLISLELEKKGAYMISAVKMIPMTKNPKADWQSYWASLTFGF
jgi:uncharacterized GH25 family protein